MFSHVRRIVFLVPNLGAAPQLLRISDFNMFSRLRLLCLQWDPLALANAENVDHRVCYTAGNLLKTIFSHTRRCLRRSELSLDQFPGDRHLQPVPDQLFSVLQTLGLDTGRIQVKEPTCECQPDTWTHFMLGDTLPELTDLMAKLKRYHKDHLLPENLRLWRPR